MEMNTRIQVEHPVTEQKDRVDLIKEMILSAQNDKLEIKQDEISFYGQYY